jgi:hypothetical protein
MKRKTVNIEKRIIERKILALGDALGGEGFPVYDSDNQTFWADGTAYWIGTEAEIRAEYSRDDDKDILSEAVPLEGEWWAIPI